MTNPVETLASTQIAQAQSQANAISSSVLGSNTFVFFAAFDGMKGIN